MQRVTETLDNMDYAILSALEENGRITITDLAAKVGLSKTPCQIRMKRLEEEGFINGYFAKINYDKLGHHLLVFVQVKMADTRTSAIQEFHREVLRIKEVEECYMTASTFDYLLKVRTKDMTIYRDILADVIAALPNVSHTTTSVVMQEVKE